MMVSNSVAIPLCFLSSCGVYHCYDPLHTCQLTQCFAVWFYNWKKKCFERKIGDALRGNHEVKANRRNWVRGHTKRSLLHEISFDDLAVYGITITGAYLNSALLETAKVPE